MVVPLQVQIRYFNLLPASANGAANAAIPAAHSSGPVVQVVIWEDTDRLLVSATGHRLQMVTQQQGRLAPARHRARYQTEADSVTARAVALVPISRRRSRDPGRSAEPRPCAAAWPDVPDTTQTAA